VIRVLIVDDHGVVREGLRHLLGRQPDLEVVGEAADGGAAVDLAASLRPDVVLLDLLMPVVDGVAALAAIRAASPGTRVVVLSSSHDDRQIMPALRAGALSYLVKDCEPEEVVAAVRAAANDTGVLSPQVTLRVLGALRGRPAAGLDALTERERQVLTHVARGHSNRRIAAALHISEETVKTHVSHVIAKLGAADRTSAAVRALRLGLIDPDL
jgi:DNA-binding NarL/FixJ family response regulator